jgi:hypothetical protein
MDYSYFPPPYDEELPRRIAEARENLSPEGVEVLDDMLAYGNSPEPGDPLEEFVHASRIRALPEREGATIQSLLSLMAAAHTAAADAAHEEKAEEPRSWWRRTFGG